MINSKSVLLNEREHASSGDPKPTTGGISALATNHKGETRDIVLSLHDRLETGTRELREPFLRRASCAGERAHTENETSFWHESVAEMDRTDFIPQEYNMVGLSSSYWKPKLCFYLLDGPSDYHKSWLRQPLRMDFQRPYAVWLPRHGDNLGKEWNRRRIKCSRTSFERDFHKYVTTVARNSDSLLKGFAELSAKEKFLIRNAGDEDHIQRTGDAQESGIMRELVNMQMLGESRESVDIRRSTDAHLSTTRPTSTKLVRLRFRSHLLVELWSIKDRMLEAKSLRMTVDQTAASGKRKRSAGESSEDASADSSEADSRSSTPDQTVSSTRRTQTVTDDEDSGWAPTPAKRPAVHAFGAEFEEDRMCDEEFEALLRDGCFGSSIPPREEPCREEGLSCTAVSVEPSAAHAAQESMELA